LLIHTPEKGAANMAIDAAILESVGRGDCPPTLRLYAWNPPCLSLGYGQSVRDVDLGRLMERGWDLVRRPTGGRAILHTDELTYSVSIPETHPLAHGSIVESYRRISRALLAALETLGLAANADKKAEGTESVAPVCFEIPSDYEITANGKKLIGSAQVRRAGGVLQHGTFPLTGDIARICDVLVAKDEDQRESNRERVRTRATTFEAASGQAVSWERAAEAVASCFAAEFAIEWTLGALGTDETTAAETLIREQYASDSWTLRR
jgi:lipoyl(octanoyl) transferase